MYDVIVIGGGVTGNIASQQLSLMGYRVLLIEKEKTPRQKSCSGILIKKTIDLVQMYTKTTIPDSVTCAPRRNKGMIFYDEQGKLYRFEQEGLNIWRDKFDYWLMTRSQEAGTEIYQETTALSCEAWADDVIVRLKHKDTVFTEQASIVIVCTGAVCPIRDKLDNRPMEYVTTYQKFLRGTINLDPHYFYAFLQRDLSGYDAWFNVKDNYLIFGVAASDASHISTYHSSFISHMTENFNAKLTDTNKHEKWVMPSITSGCPVRLGKGRILFAGETAGFLNPMGEGISCGVESGYASALSVQQTYTKGTKVNNDDLHKAYFNNSKELHRYMKRQWAFVGSISSSFRHIMQ